MRKVLVLFTLLTVAPSQASIVGAISKKVSNVFKSTKPSIDLVAQGKILESNMDNLIIRANSEMGKGVILEDISSALNNIISKISASGTYSFISFKALRNIYMDLNSL